MIALAVYTLILIGIGCAGCLCGWLSERLLFPDREDES